MLLLMLLLGMMMLRLMLILQLLLLSLVVLLLQLLLPSIVSHVLINAITRGGVFGGRSLIIWSGDLRLWKGLRGAIGPSS